MRRVGRALAFVAAMFVLGLAYILEEEFEDT